jgi:alginate O-acetyltransferase complex protein AlgI
MLVAGKIWLVASSLFFYSWWNPIYVPLIVGSLLFNFIITSVIIKSNKRPNKKPKMTNFSLLVILLFFNVGLLAYFKYMDFFIKNFNFSFDQNIQLLNLALPLAISFFTLQQIAYVVDCYEGLVKKTNLIDYAVFVTFFPQLIAGPIVHHKDILPQFSKVKNKAINYKNIVLGLFVFSIGLFKKTVIADVFARWANQGFDIKTTLDLLEAWTVSLSYTFQIYFDFSGYMDMAIGLALLFNIRLPVNFNSPYKAISMIDFWKRWHITLTNFITTYIYTPLLRKTKKLTFHKAMLITLLSFVISGIWHGAGWMFIFWGILHGVGIVVNHYWRKTRIKLYKIFAWIITFNYINITMIFFRANEWGDASKVLTSMFSLKNIVLPDKLSGSLSFLNQYGVEFDKWTLGIDGFSYTVIFLALGFIITLGFKNSSQIMGNFKPSYVNLIYTFFLFLTSITLMSQETEFIYFNF